LSVTLLEDQAVDEAQLFRKVHHEQSGSEHPRELIVLLPTIAAPVSLECNHQRAALNESDFKVN
jgi:hypothetical protein